MWRKIKQSTSCLFSTVIVRIVQHRQWWSTHNSSMKIQQYVTIKELVCCSNSKKFYDKATINRLSSSALPLLVLQHKMAWLQWTRLSGVALRRHQRENISIKKQQSMVLLKGGGIENSCTVTVTNNGSRTGKATENGNNQPKLVVGFGAVCRIHYLTQSPTILNNITFLVKRSHRYNVILISIVFHEAKSKFSFRKSHKKWVDRQSKNHASEQGLREKNIIVPCNIALYVPLCVPSTTKKGGL